MIYFKLDGRKRRAQLPSKDHLTVWSNYHITKHIIGDFENENFSAVIGLSEEECEKIRNRQINQLYCGLYQETPDKEVCLNCNFVDECFQVLNPIRENYLKVIRCSLKNDRKKPRHAHFLRRGKREQLVFLNAQGVNTILRDARDRYYITTCYREGRIDWRMMKLGLFTGKNDDRYYLHSGKLSWNRKLNSGDYKNVRKCAPQNWEIEP